MRQVFLLSSHFINEKMEGQKSHDYQMAKAGSKNGQSLTPASWPLNTTPYLSPKDMGNETIYKLT